MKLVAVRMAAATFVLTGLAYPLAVTAVAQLAFPRKAAGTLVVMSGRAVGSELIGQGFTAPGYFHPRPSAAGGGYDAANSSGSNLGPTSRALRDRIASEIERLRRENPEAPAAVPVDLVTASGSGLDPHISPEAADWQMPRVARARRLSPERLHELVVAHTERRVLGILGEPRVNVLLLNLAVDDASGAPPAYSASSPVVGPEAPRNPRVLRN